jgi:hypothetical protein
MYGQEVEANFKEIRDDGRPRQKETPMNLPATIDAVSYLRHPKAPAEADYTKAKKDEINLDVELGLQGQFTLDQNSLLKQDINELTKSNDYREVTPRILDKLFKMAQLKTMCFVPNVKEISMQTFRGIRVPLLFSVLTVALVVACVQLGYKGNGINGPHSMYLDLSALVTGIGAVCSVVIGISSFFSGGVLHNDVVFEYCFLGVRLKMESVNQTKMKIPYPAKLKMKEAKDSGLFKDFVITHPEFYTESKKFKPELKLPSFPDPIVLGVAEDNRMFMVAWWDIKRDIDRVKENIKVFKKFKVV